MSFEQLLLVTDANILSKMESKNKNEENLSELTKRFLEEVERIGVSFYNIAKSTGVQEAMFTKIKRGIQEPSKKFLSKFAECYPNANMKYIYLGNKEDPIESYDKENKTINDVTKRFIDTYKSMGLTGYRMEKNSSVITNRKIFNIENDITDVTVDIIVDFCATYNTVNSDYILTGRGPMFFQNKIDENEENKQSDKDSHDEMLLQILEKVLSEMKELRKENKKLIEKITELETLVKLPKRA